MISAEALRGEVSLLLLSFAYVLFALENGLPLADGFEERVKTHITVLNDHFKEIIAAGVMSHANSQSIASVYRTLYHKWYLTVEYYGVKVVNIQLKNPRYAFLVEQFCKTHSLIEISKLSKKNYDKYKNTSCGKLAEQSYLLSCENICLYALNKYGTVR